MKDKNIDSQSEPILLKELEHLKWQTKLQHVYNELKVFCVCVDANTVVIVIVLCVNGLSLVILLRVNRP